jgi:hypothetical protein
MVNKAYKSGVVFKKDFVDPRELNRARMVVSNVLRSLALHYPDEYLGVRQTVRTWSTYENGVWRLSVGPSTVKQVGRPPGGNTATTGFVGNPIVPTSTEYYHDQTIGTAEEFSRFAGRVLELQPETNVATAEFADVLENLEPFEAMFGDHWNIEAVGPTTLQLTRK